MVQSQPGYSDKPIWLTGASGGLGRGIAWLLARQGYPLALHCRENCERAETLARDLAERGCRVITTRGDLGLSVTSRKAYTAIREGLGVPYALVHLAGSFHRALVAEHSLEQFQEQLNSNITGFFLAAKALLPAMREAGRGRLITFGMAGAQYTTPMRFLGPHLASKSAQVALARTLALEEAPHGITVNVVNPGRIDKKELSREEALKCQAGPTFPLGYPGSYEDLAAAVLFLLSGEASTITGAVLDVTGGWMGDDWRIGG